MILLNAFSLNMMHLASGQMQFSEISLDEARRALAAGFESAIGHQETAAVLGEQLGMEVPMNRISVALGDTDSAIVGQYRGPRLEEGATSLPEGAAIRWYIVRVFDAVPAWNDADFSPEDLRMSLLG